MLMKLDLILLRLQAMNGTFRIEWFTIETQLSFPRN